jgi:hypothetical protein
MSWIDHPGVANNDENVPLGTLAVKSTTHLRRPSATGLENDDDPPERRYGSYPTPNVTDVRCN